MKNEIKGKKLELEKIFDDLMLNLGYPQEKQKLLKALIESKEGSVIDIARKAKVERTSRTYEFLHQLSRDVKGITEIDVSSEVSKAPRFRYYITSIVEVCENLCNMFCERERDELSALQEKITRAEDLKERTVGLAREIFEMESGVESLTGEIASCRIESVDELMRKIRDLAKNAEKRFFFLGRSGDRVDPGVLTMIRNGVDCRLITMAPESKRTRIKLRRIENTLGVNIRYLKEFDPDSGVDYLVRMLIADDEALLFQWEKDGHRIKWALYLSEKEFLLLLVRGFEKLWEQSILPQSSV